MAIVPSRAARIPWLFQFQMSSFPLTCRHCVTYTMREDRMMRVRDFSNDNPPLHPGDELHCPLCQRWHPVSAMHVTGTQYTTEMLLWECRGGRFYAGQMGTPSRHETRAAAN
jgi:hypothetical protein